MKKAFDRVEYKSVFKVMEWFNFGPNMIKYVRILFQNFKLATVNNGYTSYYFVLTRGLFQGNPISSYLFILMIELLATQLRNNPDIKGLRVKSKTLLLMQFADDLGLIMEYNERSWNKVVEVFENFQRQSGLLLNYEKSVIYRIGSLRNSNAKFYSVKKLQWTNDSFKVLGIHLTADYQELCIKNYEPLIAKAKAVLQLWTTRGLSLFGKILIINSLVGSLFVYRMAVLPTMPQHYIKKLYELFQNFIWNKKRPKIPLKILMDLKTNRGAGLVDLEEREKAIKVQWINRIQKNKLLKELANEMLNNKMGDNLWNMQLNENHANMIFNQKNFWHDVAKTWASVTYHEKVEDEKIGSEPIWFNSRICIGGKPISDEVLSQQGLNTISDLVSDNDKILDYTDVSRKYSYITRMKYNQIVSAIPKAFKKKLNKDATELEQITQQYATVKTAYRKLKPSSNLLVSKAHKLAQRTNEEINVDDLVQFATNITKITICVKLRSFQYRLLINAILTNRHLHLFGILDTDRCSFCLTELDTIEHMFYYCDRVQQIWQRCITFFSLENVNVKSVLCNDVKLNPKDPCNTLILIIKYYLYKAKCLKERISFESVKNYIREYIELERNIAKNRNKLNLHEIKWNNIMNF